MDRKLKTPEAYCKDSFGDIIVTKDYEFKWFDKYVEHKCLALVINSLEEMIKIEEEKLSNEFSTKDKDKLEEIFISIYVFRKHKMNFQKMIFKNNKKICKLGKKIKSISRSRSND